MQRTACRFDASPPRNCAHEACPFVEAPAKAKLAGRIEAQPGGHLAPLTAFRVVDVPIMAARNIDVRRERILLGFHCRKLGLDVAFRCGESFQGILKACRAHDCSIEHPGCGASSALRNPQSRRAAHVLPRARRVSICLTHVARYIRREVRATGRGLGIKRGLTRPGIYELARPPSSRLSAPLSPAQSLLPKISSKSTDAAVEGTKVGKAFTERPAAPSRDGFPTPRNLQACFAG